MIEINKWISSRRKKVIIILTSLRRLRLRMRNAHPHRGVFDPSVRGPKVYYTLSTVPSPGEWYNFNFHFVKKILLKINKA
jgi:hypothetical protein